MCFKTHGSGGSASYKYFLIRYSTCDKCWFFFIKRKKKDSKGTGSSGNCLLSCQGQLQSCLHKKKEKKKKRKERQEKVHPQLTPNCQPRGALEPPSPSSLPLSRLCPRSLRPSELRSTLVPTLHLGTLSLLHSAAQRLCFRGLRTVTLTQVMSSHFLPPSYALRAQGRGTGFLAHSLEPGLRRAGLKAKQWIGVKSAPGSCTGSRRVTVLVHRLSGR